MIKTVCATFECDVCAQSALSIGEGLRFELPKGWLNATLEVAARRPDALYRGVSAEGHVCSIACLITLFETKILDPLDTSSTSTHTSTDPENSDAESST